MGDSYVFGYVDRRGNDCRPAVLSIADAMLERAPTWAGGAEHPPLSAGEAIRRATQAKQAFVADSGEDKWGLVSAALVPRVCGGQQRWYWLVTYEIREAGTGPAIQFRIGVLMDGTVVEPKTVSNVPPGARPSDWLGH